MAGATALAADFLSARPAQENSRPRAGGFSHRFYGGGVGDH